MQPKSTPSSETTSTKLTNINTDEQEKDNIVEETIVVDVQGNVVGE